MRSVRLIGLVLVVMAALPTLGYRMESGEFYVGAGFGVDINVAPMERPSATPGALLPLWGSVDYMIDKNWGIFGSVLPSFGVNALGFGLRAGAKYWLTDFDLPVYPYVSLAFAPSMLVPFKGANHYNLGLSPGIGATYFVVAKFMVGVHVHMNPSIAFASGERKFEFGVMPFFDLNLRL